MVRKILHLNGLQVKYYIQKSYELRQGRMTTVHHPVPTSIVKELLGLADSSAAIDLAPN
jgi:hypothetical protein